MEELEKEGDVLVTRTVKDGQMRLVFWNEVRPDEESGGMPVEQGVSRRLSHFYHRYNAMPLEFQDLWRSLTVPDDTDLLKSLASGMAQSIIVFTILQLLPAGLQKAYRPQRLRLLSPSFPLARKRGKNLAPDSASPASPMSISRVTLTLQRTMYPRI